ncbi:ribonuclease T2 family protein [Pseudooceanicola algae]|uniref:Ribonuclease n=1 Tax=Pseudooceanicola algae TaxID=1537215 RepID=A0A418SIX2_9RHOB|nr:ribonuclease T2 [Pseudooceanicola algae]QPM91137.1 Ribonuclease [Pseudooceanicola algae]
MPKLLACLILSLFALPLRAQDRPGQFDYYLAAFSWSPGYCEATGGESEQCAPGADYAWILHGLWPQYERGYPRDCPSTVAAPSRRQTAEMADIMGTAGLAFHEWRTHGTCSGLSARAYFDLSRKAFEAIRLPAFPEEATEDLRLRPARIGAALEALNPAIPSDGYVLRCEDGRLREVRICLDRDDLSPRPCGADLRSSCGGGAVTWDVQD